MPLVENAAIVRSIPGMSSAWKQQTQRIFSMIDREVDGLAEEKGLFPRTVRLLQPVHICVYFDPYHVYVALDLRSGAERVEMSFNNSMPVSMEYVLTMTTERMLGFRDPFGFNFPLFVLEEDAGAQAAVAIRIVHKMVDEDTQEIERQERIVTVNPIFQGRDFLLDRQLVFVLSPFEDPFDTLFREHIRPTVENLGLACIRADDIFRNRAIMEDVWEHINKARLLIADLTDENPNVFYEVGIAHTVGKEVILIAKSIDDVPFDLGYLRCVIYDRGYKTFAEELAKTISEVLKAVL